MLVSAYNYVKKASVGEVIQMIAGILAIIAIAFGAYFFIDSRYARCEDVRRSDQQIADGLKKMGERLDYKIVSDQYKDVRDRIWKIEDRMKGILIIKWPQSVLDEYRRLQEELKSLDRDLTTLKTQQKPQ